MAYGVNDAAITTNDLLTQFSPQLIPRVEAGDAFAPFFRHVPKPTGIGNVMNWEIDSTADEADQQAPLTHRVSRKRSGYEIEVHIKDKFRDSRTVSWEKVRKGRVDEPQAAVLNCAQAMARARNKELGRYLQTNASQNSGTPTDPTAPSNGETPYWWNSNDTVAPPAYGENTFSVGEDHVETGVTAVTLDRIRIYMDTILSKGYGETGLTMMVQTQEERTILNLAQTAQQNQTLGVALRDEFQRAGRASSVNGLFGLNIIQSEWISAGVIPVFASDLASIGGEGGAVKVEELPLTTDMEDVKDIQGTVFEATEQYGAGILHKGAGYTAHVA